MRPLVAGLAGAAVLLVPLAAAQAAPPAAPAAGRIPVGTPIELMVTKEVNSRTAKAGDRFKLRVNAPVIVDGQTVIPVGATAWGEITHADGTGAVGGKGHMGAKLLYIDLDGRPLPITGSQVTKGKGNTAGVVIGVVAFGIFGLLMKGGNANFKAGDILTGYVADPNAALPAAAVP